LPYSSSHWNQQAHSCPKRKSRLWLITPRNHEEPSPQLSGGHFYHHPHTVIPLNLQPRLRPKSHTSSSQCQVSSLTEACPKQQTTAIPSKDTTPCLRCSFLQITPSTLSDTSTFFTHCPGQASSTPPFQPRQLQIPQGSPLSTQTGLGIHSPAPTQTPGKPPHPGHPSSPAPHVPLQPEKYPPVTWLPAFPLHFPAQIPEKLFILYRLPPGLKQGRPLSPRTTLPSFLKLFPYPHIDTGISSTPSPQTNPSKCPPPRYK